MCFGEYETGFERNLYSPEDRDPFYNLIRFTPRNENLSVHTLVRKLDHDKLYECDFTSYPFNEESRMKNLGGLMVHSRETRYRVGTLADRVSYEMRRTRILPRIFIGKVYEVPNALTNSAYTDFGNIDENKSRLSGAT
ncbi:hypothetical protein V1477_003449 [Vespula maculifrons]|uniref:Uncharacterized protein n=1 Tax=Vespula maculifrons TaxID=7453 RepID=A0ABD2CSQ8_VESMC